MKKISLFFYLFFIGILGVSAKTINVEFSDCVDGDTAKFVYKDEVITARFLAIDTPETKHPSKGVEPYGKEASEYTCSALKKAKIIELEYDENSDKLDKYERHLVWVFVDDSLLQKELVSEGLASVAYLYGDYKYTDILEEVEQDAEDNRLGIWSTEEENKETKKNKTTKKDEINYKEIIMLFGIIVIMCCFSTKTRNKVKNKAKSQLKKEIKKRLK